MSGVGPERSLDALRSDRLTRVAATLSGAGIGLAVATLHWVGFVLGGTLVALPQQSVGRGFGAAVGFGAAAWVVFAASMALAGALDAYLAMGQIFALSVAVPLAGAALGGLLRGVA